MPEYPSGPIFFRKKLVQYYYQQKILEGYLKIICQQLTLYYTLLCINHYLVQSLFVKSLFVATTTPCNCVTCHQYEPYKKPIVYKNSHDNDIN
jgi:hypothetical protein